MIVDYRIITRRYESMIGNVDTQTLIYKSSQIITALLMEQSDSM